MTGRPHGLATVSRSRRCPFTGSRDCRSRRCELHYMLAPLRFGPNRYAIDRFPFTTYDRVPVRFGTALVDTGNGFELDARRGLLILTGRPRTYARLRRTVSARYEAGRSPVSRAPRFA